MDHSPENAAGRVDPAALPEAPEPRISIRRVLVALVLLVAAVGGGSLAVQHSVTSEARGDDFGPWFAPYVDTTLTPRYPFQAPSANPARDVVLGFVVADPQRRCAPSWGGYESLDGAASALDLDRRVAQVQGQGGEAIVSFGGQANTELAVACADQAQLTAAYRATIERYGSETVDFDIEGEAITDAAANARRAKAIRTLQEQARADHRSLAVWLTLPATPDGLAPEAIAVVRSMLDAHVGLAGVNAMAMDFGATKPATQSMSDAVESAVEATHDQVAALYAGAPKPPSSDAIWQRIGMTVMIGQNDEDAERLTVADARKLTDFARSSGLGRVSMWSLNRDAQCGVTFAMIGTHSNLCSGARQQRLQFAKTFARLAGTAHTHAGATTGLASIPAAATATPDDPARSPYPIWSPQQAYPEHYKVVWHQAVYEARWYTQGQIPGAPAGNVANDPWQLVGPVLKTDRAPEIEKLPAGTYPAWNSDAVYRKGQRILFHGLPYRAKWYTEGDVPGEVSAQAPSPWEPLYRIPGEPAPLG